MSILTKVSIDNTIERNRSASGAVLRPPRPAPRSANLPLIPPPSSSLPAKRMRTRTALVDAALTLIADKGPEGASIDELVRLAGMARGTFYNYFPSWDELLQALVQRMDDEVSQVVERRLKPDWDATTTVACAMRGFIQVSVDDPRVGWAWIRLGPRMHAWLQDPTLDRKLSKRAVHALCGDAGALPAAHCVLGGAAFMTSRRLLEGDLRIEDLDEVIRMVLRALGAPEADIPAALAQARAFAAEVSTRA